MINNLQLLMISGPKHDISKRHLKRCIFTLFVFKIFLAKNHFKKIYNQNISTKLEGYRLVYELS